MKKELPLKIVSMSALNAQENTPARISNSRFKEAKWNGFVSEVGKL
jgi:hypothetical protein